PVIDRPGTVQGRPALLDCCQECCLAPDIEIGLLLAGKTCVRQVFCRGARPDRYDEVVRRDLFVGLLDLVADRRRHLRLQHHGLRTFGRFLEGLVIFDIELVIGRKDLRFKAGLDKEPAEGLGSDHEGFRDGKTDRRHLSKGSPFAPYRDDVFLPYLLEPQNIRHIFHARTTVNVNLTCIITIIVLSRPGSGTAAGMGGTFRDFLGSASTGRITLFKYCADIVWVFMADAKVLVSDPLAEEGLAILRAACDVDVRTGLSEDELCSILGDYDALLVRSGTEVTAKVIEAGRNLRFIGRAGVGVDNIDVDAATRKGILVANAPEGNTLAATEHTMAMMQALARNIPQANASLK